MLAALESLLLNDSTRPHHHTHISRSLMLCLLRIVLSSLAVQLNLVALILLLSYSSLAVLDGV